MKVMAKLLMVVLTFVVSLGIFYTPKVYAEDPGSRKEVVYMDGHWYEITYNKDGGIVTIKIYSND
jgi:hypothetical protein